MSQLPKTLELDRIGIERLQVSKPTKEWLKRAVDRLEELYKMQRDRIETLNPQAHIIDADGDLADITTKFNTLLGQLESQGLLDTS